MRILIVDDDTGTLNALKACVMSAGHEAVVMNNPFRALSYVAASVGKSPAIDVLVTDLKMPGMDGLELIRAARETRSELRAVLMTAYGSDRVRNRLSELRSCEYLDKPFNPAEFISAIEKTRTGS